MEINKNTGLITGVNYIASPNNDDRPDDVAADLIVLHSISLPPGEYGGPWIEKLFTNQLPGEKHPYFKEITHLRVSAHILIRRDGSLVQFVPFHQRAWHAGESCYRERIQCNDFSIGIELEGTDSDPFETTQYEQLAELVLCLDKTYTTLSLDHITGHSDIAPGRKTDPGTGFSWEKIAKLLKSA